MDVKSLIENMKAYLTCPICLGYFTNPMTVKCGHSFCRDCLLQYRERVDATLTCPECRRIIKFNNVILNKTLQSLVSTGKMLRTHLLQSMLNMSICEQHWEREKLFCEEDQRVLCEFCSLAPEHKEHHVLPMDRAVDICKNKLKEIHNILREKEEDFKTALTTVTNREEFCKVDIHNLKQSTRFEYEKIYQFFQNEEKQRLQILEEEYQNSLAKLKKNKAKLTQQIQDLQRMMLEIEENLDKEPSEMLQDKKRLLERNEESLLLEPETTTLCWSTCPITGLREVLMSYHRDITLDPETASPYLILSKDLKYVRYRSVPGKLPDNDETSIVLGARTFTSGKHYWEVELGDNEVWEVGICKKSIRQNEKFSILPDNIISLEGFKSGDDFIIWEPHDAFRVDKPIKKIGILLDYEKGHVAFYNVIAESLIHSPPNVIFREPLCPYFSICVHNEEGPPASLTICPKNK